jgi:hypothetical protein
MQRSLFALMLAYTTLSCQFVFAADNAGQSPIQLANEVRSILSNRCFACHGPDENERQAGLRLDDRDSFTSPSDSGEKAVEPKDSGASELLRRLLTEDESERMPPEDFGARLSETEIEQIKKWIDDGAMLPQHWSFIEPSRHAVPAVEATQATTFGINEQVADWSRHAIDRFVLDAQLRRGLKPSVPATKAELLRRLSLDLIGLPPTKEEVAAFESDHSAEAYEKQVDRLLASPAFGEHWARKWLDLARYADSAGYADDPPRTIWAYRDWVIDALNSNKPIDEFTIEQIAGDLLPEPTQDQLIATAFNRNTLTNNEGGTNDEEFRNVAIVDRVNTTMAVWMGVTMACAQCHTHKYDPFTHDEYFKLFAIFNQSQDMDRRDESPLVELFTTDQLFNKRQWETRLEELQQQLEMPSELAAQELNSWESTLREPVWKSLKPQQFSSTSKSDAAFLDGDTVRVKPAEGQIATDTYTLQFDVDATTPLQALALRTLPNEELPQSGAGLNGGNFVVTGITGTLRPKVSQSVEAQFVRIELPGKDKILSLAEVQVFSSTENIAINGKATQSSTAFSGEASRAIDGNTSGIYEENSTTHTETAKDQWWEVDLQKPAPIDRIAIWNRLGSGLPSRLDGAKVILLDANRQTVFTATLTKAPEISEELAVSLRKPVRFSAAYADFAQSGFPAAAVVDGDAKSGWAVAGQIAQSHLLTLIPSEPIAFHEPAILTLQIEHNSPHANHLLGSFRVESSTETSAEAWAALPIDLRAIHLKRIDERSPGEQMQLVAYFNRHLAPSTASIRRETKELTDKLAALKPATSVPVMRDLEASRQRETFVQLRGNYKSLGNQVVGGTPQVFHPASLRRSEQKIPDRLDLARWLVDRRNPLTARVWVNRLWESLFGIGIVRSSEEFGSQGDKPTHPELLDWLACEFMGSGWDNKRMLRLLVTSEAYRQTSMVSRELLEADKENIWLARGPRVRLSAEMIRDQSLAAAGLLSRSMYGPPVRPPQPNSGLSAAFGSATDWQTSQGEDRYRRGLYTTWRRSNPYPSMATFDAPSREVCTLRRDSTNTPLQALVTLNDPGFVEAAQALARSVALNSQSENDAQRLDDAFEGCTSRAPREDEREALLNLLTAARKQLAGAPEAAMKLATDPLGPLPDGADATELAAWTAVCNVLLNLDEVLMKR